MQILEVRKNPYVHQLDREAKQERGSFCLIFSPHFLHSSKELFSPLRILKAQTYHSPAGKPSAVSYHPEDPIQIPNMTCTVLVTWLLSILIPISFRVSFAF